METTSEGSSLVLMESSYSKQSTGTMRRNLMRVDENQANSNRQMVSMFEETVRQFEGVRAPKVPIKSRMTEGEWQDSR